MALNTSKHLTPLHFKGSKAELNSTQESSRKFAVSRKILNMLRTSRRTENWRFFVQLS